MFSAMLLAQSLYRAMRRVIDISGDGVNNHGQFVTMARDEVLAQGIVINSLPIMLKRPNFSGTDIEQLADYYEDCVIGGPGAFIVTVHEREKFVEAIRTKLVQEVADLPAPQAPALRVIPASTEAPRASPAASASGCGRSAGAIDRPAFTRRLVGGARSPGPSQISSPAMSP